MENRVHVEDGTSSIFDFQLPPPLVLRGQHLNICNRVDLKQTAASADDDEDDETHLNPPS